MAFIRNAIENYVRNFIEPISGPVSDAILALSPTAYWKTSNGYYVDGCLVTGKGPHGVGAVNNWVQSTSGSLASGTQGVSISVWFVVDADNGVDSTIVSKGAAAKFEFELTRSRTTGFVTFKPYALNGASSATATSTIATVVGTWYHVSCHYNSVDSKAYISVNNETPVVSSGTVTIGSSDGAFRVGSWFNATQNLQGRVDHLGISVGSSYCYAQRVQLYNSGSGKPHADITGVKTLTAWWDFGNAATNSTGYDPTHGSYDRLNLTAWDWLVDVVGGLTLTQQTGGTTYPYVARGYNATLSTAATTKKVFGWDDVTANDYDAIQPWYGLRTSYDPTGIDSGPAFYFDGVVSTGINDYCGQFMHCFPVGNLLNGDKSYAFVAIIKCKDPFHPSAQASPVDDLLGETICGAGTNGFLPWGTYITGLSSTAGGFANRFQLSNKYETALTTLGLKHHWYSKRNSDDGKCNNSGDTYRGSIDTTKHAIGYQYDAATKVTTFIIDGAIQYNPNQASDNIGGGGSVGTMTLNAFTIGDGFMHRDQYVVPGGTPTGAFGAGGWAFYGWMKDPAVWVDTATPSVAAIQQLTKDMNTSYAATATTKPFYYPPYTPTKWFDPGYAFKELTAALAVTQASANNDPVGAWMARTGNASVTASDSYLAPANGQRPFIVTSYQNGLPVLHSDGTDDCLRCIYDLAQPFTIYMVLDWDHAANTYKYLWSSPAKAEIIGMNNQTQMQAFAGSASPIAFAASSTLHVFAWVVSNGAHKLYIDGADQSATIGGALGIVSYMDLFAYNQASYWTNAHLGDHLLFNSAHNPTQIGQVSAWLKAIWGTA